MSSSGSGVMHGNGPIVGNAMLPSILGGSCGACEIEVNGETERACVAQVPASPAGPLTVAWASDPYW